MRSIVCVAAVCAAFFAPQQAAQNLAPQPDDSIKTIVGRLDLEKYKATIKGLTQFGDRRQGTQRNRDAVNWIQKQLESYGYTNAERITYDPPVPTRECGPSVPASVVRPREGGAGAAGRGAAGGRRGGGAGGRGGGAAGAGGARIVRKRAPARGKFGPMAQPH